MIWPGDFVHKQTPVLSGIKDKYIATGLMDGGIYDNPGIIGLLLYKAESPDFDLLIVSDVKAPYMAPYEPVR